MTTALTHSPEELTAIATRIRRNIITSVRDAKSGHPGTSLSATDLLTALYFGHMRHDPQNPRWEGRDRFVMSKGHGSPGLYGTLAEAGYLERAELSTFRAINSRLQGHPDMHKLPGVETSTGSLGHGLSYALGMALALRLDASDARVYALLGDGECQEGQVWEAAMAASHYKAGNLTAIVDRNGLQIDGATEDVMSLEPFADKWRAFGWRVVLIDGHDFPQILSALTESREQPVLGQPTLILAKTVKGKGVSFMENQVKWHGTAPNAEQAEAALKELV
jgi:transketolase